MNPTDLGHRRRWVPWLITFSSIGFGAGIVLPLFTIQPGAGEWTSLVRLCAADQMQSRTLTLPGGILQLWQGGEVGLTILLGLLSLVLPIAKLSVLWWECFLVGDIPESFLNFFRAISRYAMVEVFVIALLVMLVKSLPGGSHIKLHLGTAAFTVSVILSLIASVESSAEKSTRLVRLRGFQPRSIQSKIIMNARSLSAKVIAIFVLTSSPSLASKDELITVRIRDGRVQEHVNGSLRRSYGSGLVDAATDGKTVVAVTRDGRIQEWVKGSMRRSYGSKVKSASIQGSKVSAQLESGQTTEYENGSLRRTF